MVYSLVKSAEGEGSLIYFRDRLFKYPFSFTNALKHLGPLDLSLVALSCSSVYCRSGLNQLSTCGRAGSDRHAESLKEDAEAWLKKRFGSHLYSIFFATYFRKLWGRSASCLPARCAVEMAEEMFDRERIVATKACFQYRSSITVALVLDCQEIFSEREIYVHSSAVQVSYIRNLIQSFGESIFQNFEDLDLTQIADSKKTCLALTYFCDENDSLWHRTRESLVQLAFQELMSLRLMPDEMVENGEECQSILEKGRVIRYALPAYQYLEATQSQAAAR